MESSKPILWINSIGKTMLYVNSFSRLKNDFLRVPAKHDWEEYAFGIADGMACCFVPGSIHGTAAHFRVGMTCHPQSATVLTVCISSSDKRAEAGFPGKRQRLRRDTGHAPPSREAR
jgi:hypothetical protein